MTRARFRCEIPADARCIISAKVRWESHAQCLFKSLDFATIASWYPTDSAWSAQSAHHGEVQVAIAKSVARSSEPNLAQYHCH